MMIPPSHYRFERIRPLNTEYQVNEKLKELRSLTELSHANQLLLAAQHRKTGKTVYTRLLHFNRTKKRIIANLCLSKSTK